MRGLIVLLVLGIGGYFMWRLAPSEARVSVRNFLLTHALKVAIITGLVIGFFFSQAIIGSVKLF
jgi:hypothetical protein